MANDPRFEVFPRLSEDTEHETFVYDRTAYHPSGDEYTVAEAHCGYEGCEWTANGDPADTRDQAAAHEREHPLATGDYGWRFRDANGRLTFTAGEGFTRREDAYRALFGATMDVVRMLLGQQIGLSASVLVLDVYDDREDVLMRVGESPSGSLYVTVLE